MYSVPVHQQQELEGVTCKVGEKKIKYASHFLLLFLETLQKLHPICCVFACFFSTL